MMGHGERRLSVRPMVVAGLLVAASFPGCHCAGDEHHTSSGNIGPKEEHELNCNCIVNFDSTAQTFGGALR